ncbi:AAA family ATPase [Cellulosimicrobium cellulans]|uniref:AAA family ATPase n=1 Tax=Cellulosimicrobium cellulans TaxID=1710 RepID=UPI001BAB8DA8|nr:AAA family ATPase [Cellulosimicrobium cellulans]QUC01111.1 AAA family ATPase [Cellulosimicrobium cellulans]
MSGTYDPRALLEEKLGRDGLADLDARQKQLVAQYAQEAEALDGPVPWGEIRERARKEAVAEANAARELQQRAEADPSAMQALLRSWAFTSDDEGLIDAILNGSVTERLPEIVPITGGGHLLYRGQVHSVAGESGSGKSWLALHSCVEHMLAGGVALYFDIETSKVRTYQRLLALGAAPDLLRRSFHYAHPTESIEETQATFIAEGIRRMSSDVLVILDSAGEGISLAGINPDSDEVAEWIRRVPRKMSDAGATVLMVDHVPKSTGNGKATFAIGSQRKRAAIDVQFMFDVDVPFSRERAGGARVRVAKDRDGNFTPGDVIADMKVVPDAGTLAIELVSTRTTSPAEKADRRREALEQRVWLAVANGYRSASAVARLLGERKEKVTDTCTRLVRDGALVETGHYRQPLDVARPMYDPEEVVPVLDVEALLNDLN